MIRVRKDEEWIKISFLHDSDYITKIKSIEGYKWLPKEKC